MSNAVDTTPISINDYLSGHILGKNLRVITSFVRKYPLLTYFGFSIPNHYKESVLSDSLTYEDAQNINFKEVGNGIQPVMSLDGKSVQWYEIDSFSYEQIVDADSTTTAVVLEDVTGFEVDDVVLTIPATGSTGTQATYVISAINTGTKTLTMSGAVTVKAGDKVKFLYPLHTTGEKVTRGTSQDNGKLVTVYFQKYGGSLSYGTEELNKTYMFFDTEKRVKNKLTDVINMSINSLAYSWYYGRNNGGTKPESQGLETLIQEKYSNGETGVIVDFSGLATNEAKIAKIQETLANAASSPIYSGSDQPTAICNDKWISAVSALLQDEVQYNQMVEKDIDWGLKTFSSTRFRSINFIVDQTQNQLSPIFSLCYLLPKHLVSFATKTYDTPDAAGVIKKYNVNGFKVIPQPVVTDDVHEFTTELWLANVFAGQTFPYSYMKLWKLS